MAKKNKQQQQRLQKAKARKSQKRAKLARIRRSGSDLTQISRWPILGAWVSGLGEHTLSQVLMARRRPDGALAVSSFLLDLQCLGVKDAVFWAKMDDMQLLDLLERATGVMSLTECSAEDAARVVEVGVSYAASIGFGPHPDYQKARRIFEGLDAGASELEVATGGPGGKPYFMSGPYDEVEGILQTLLERLGPDGFDYTAEVFPDPGGALFSEE